jgi:hypothetical protein
MPGPDPGFWQGVVYGIALSAAIVVVIWLLLG